MNGYRETMLLTISLIRIRFKEKKFLQYEYDLENNYLIYMKTLKDFIKESQEINEGLFGDIVRKLLDTGLSWIEGSAKWVADHVVKTTAELWDTTKNITDKGWERLRFRSGYKGHGAPEDEYEYAKMMSGLHREKDFNKRLKYIDDTFDELQNEFGSKSDWAAHWYEQRMKTCFITLSDPNASDKEKEVAKKILIDIKAKDKNGKYGLTKLIDDFLKGYEKNNKKK